MIVYVLTGVLVTHSSFGYTVKTIDFISPEVYVSAEKCLEVLEQNKLRLTKLGDVEIQCQKKEIHNEKSSQ